jgi:hypothetical protein
MKKNFNTQICNGCAARGDFPIFLVLVKYHTVESRAGFEAFTVKKRGSLAHPQDTFCYLFHRRKVGRPEGV